MELDKEEITSDTSSDEEIEQIIRDSKKPKKYQGKWKNFNSFYRCFLGFKSKIKMLFMLSIKNTYGLLDNPSAVQ